MEFPNLHQFGVVYEMSLDMIAYKRTVYSTMDWVSDIGGLSSAMTAVFALMLKLLKFQAVDFYLISRLYKRKTLEEGKTSDDEEIVDETYKDDEDLYLSLKGIS